MTQSKIRSSILLALVGFMIVVVESSSQTIGKVDNAGDIRKDVNETQYDLDIQMNFLDSELKKDENDTREMHQAEPIVIDLGHDFNNITNPTDKSNATTLGENVENNVENEDPVDEFSTTAVHQSEVDANETNEKVDHLGQTVEAVPLETTTVPNPDETISTLVPINENIPSVDNTLAAVDSKQVETQTQSIEIHQETSTNYNSKKLHDLSIYFESQPSRARQLRGFNKETDNEVIAHADPGSGSGPESDSSSNTSSDSDISHSSDRSSGQDDNKTAEDSSISEDLSSEKTYSETKSVAGSLANIVIEDPAKSMGGDLVEEIEAVTESIGEITNDVTVVANEETHSIMKKPGVDDESPTNITDGSIPEQTNEIGVTKSDTKVDPVVNLVLNRPKQELEPSPTTISSTGNQSSDNEDDVLTPLAVTEMSNSEKAQIPIIIDEISETKSLLESNILDKSKEVEDDSNSVDFNIETPPNQQDNKLGIKEQISLPELQKPLKPHPENASNTQNNESFSGLNVINNDKTLEANLLIDNIETSTQVPSLKIKEPSLFKNTQEDQPSKEENGIFKDIKENPLQSTEESFADVLIHKNDVETSTEIPIDGKIDIPVKDQLEENQIGTIVDNTTPTTMNDESSPAILKDKLTSGLNEEPFSGLNSIPDSENNLSKDHMQSSNQSPSANVYDSELVGEVQDDQTSKTDNEFFKKEDDVRLSPTDDSLPDPKHYEQPVETSTEKPIIYKIDDPTNQFGTTTDYARHVDSLHTMRDESSSVVSDGVIVPASVGHSLKEVIAEGLGKPLPTRSVGDEPSSSSYSSEDKTTTVLVLCAAAGGIFIAFSLAIYLISFQRQHGTLDIEMQEQRCGKDNLDDDDDSETRVSLLNQIPTIDSDEHSSD